MNDLGHGDQCIQVNTSLYSNPADHAQNGVVCLFDIMITSQDARLLGLACVVMTKSREVTRFLFGKRLRIVMILSLSLCISKCL